MKKHIFISYTLRDNEIGVEFLNRFKQALNLFNDVDTFIDIIDNNGTENHQEYIFGWIKKADYICLIETKQVYFSEWVRKEIDAANKFRIPIIKISVQDVRDFIAEPVMKRIIKS